MTTTTTYQAVTRNLTQSLQRTAQAPVTARETQYYLANIGKIKSLDAFMGDDRIYRYALKAFGLEDMIFAKAFIRKVLAGGVDSRSSFANKLSDGRYKELATTFDFGSLNSATTSFDRAQQGTVDRYVRQSFEQEQGDKDENLRLALYFERKASTLTNAFQILADPALLKVVQTALAIPRESSAMPIDKQAEMIQKKLDLDTLKDPAGLKRFMLRFTSLAEIESRAASSPTMLLFGQPSSALIGQDVLTSLQKLRLGGV